jgi:hypothetical protein
LAGQRFLAGRNKTAEPSLSKTPCDPEKVGSLTICPLRRLWRVQCRSALAAPRTCCRRAQIPVVAGVLYAVGLRPRYRENDALTDVLFWLKPASISSPIGPDTGCAADQIVATPGHAKSRRRACPKGAAFCLNLPDQNISTFRELRCSSAPQHGRAESNGALVSA